MIRISIPYIDLPLFIASNLFCNISLAITFLTNDLQIFLCACVNLEDDVVLSFLSSCWSKIILSDCHTYVDIIILFLDINFMVGKWFFVQNIGRFWKYINYTQKWVSHEEHVPLNSEWCHNMHMYIKLLTRKFYVKSIADISSG